MNENQPNVSDVVRWIMLLQDHEGEVRSRLAAPDAEGFDGGLRQLAVDVRDHPEKSGEIPGEFLQFVDHYQPVDQWLQEKDPAFRAFRAGPEAAQADSYVPPDPATDPAAAPGAVGPWGMTQDGRQSEEPTRAAAPSTNGTQHPEQNGQGRKRSGKVANTTNKAPWTPELKLQLFKEIITALLGLVIIGFTLWFALRCFNLAGNTKKISDAKDLLTILLGLAGVVVGYYFGRVPADARAAQASNRADTAVQQREQVKAQARGISGQLDNILANGAREATRSGGAPTADVAGLRSVRDQLHDLGAPAE